ncbi:hypothetical protein MBLNU457_g0572t1 [Dothideomycetes sp. NU457]
MDEPVIQIFKQSLSEDCQGLLQEQIECLEIGHFESLLRTSTSQTLLGLNDTNNQNNDHIGTKETWHGGLDTRLKDFIAAKDDHAESHSATHKAAGLFVVAYGALLAFLQSNVTGPPLPFSSARLMFPKSIPDDARLTQLTRRNLISSLTVDGVAAYQLTPNIELFYFANTILNHPFVLEYVGVARWAKLRSSFVHQRLLSEPASTLESHIYQDLDLTQEHLSSIASPPESAQSHLLLEQASIDIYYGFDKRARAALDKAAQKEGFVFALTGALGKRTKFQQNDISQLVVLAKSADKDRQGEDAPSTNDNPTGPTNLDLNDDTLLESISFTEKPASTTDIRDASSLPPSLANLDPSDQPRLQPLDSVTLLALASSITNTSPSDGLTREETLPYATRVLDGGSSNWQIYTQALLVRSRIEGYKSRTVERGLLQLQALVDQVIADTAPTPARDGAPETEVEAKATSFLPKPKESESASAPERLRYVFQLASPARWDLESELAQRWVQLGGLRSALEIYERLEMWAEAALCWAATDKEDRARKLVRKQLFHATDGRDDHEVDDDEKWEGKERVPSPPDAPRLFCILGDIGQDPAMYEKSWEVSDQKYARAQRSLGRMYFAAKDFVRAAEGYGKSLRVNQLNHTSWFALGCALLELGQFEKAVESFTRCVQLEDTDAEAWSNLAAALLKQEPPEPAEPAQSTTNHDDDDLEAEDTASRAVDPQKNKQDALRALKRAATLKHDSYRIWENVLVVAASISPPDFVSVVSAQRQLIKLRGSTIGEQCIDLEIMQLLVQYVVSSADTYDASKPGFERLMVEMVDKQIVPLITSSRPLWQLVARLAIWRNKPASALDAQEKAWRCVTNQPGWETDTEARWNEVVDATVSLCDAYESLGPKEKNEGLSAGEGVLVAKDWKFKAKSAIRGIMGRGKASWEDTEGWYRLTDAMDGLKG